MPEEPRLFLRSALFGVVVAAIYWWASGDLVGTILLGAFGLGGVFVTSMLIRSWRASGGRVDPRPRRLLGLETLDHAYRLIPEVLRLPAPSLVPLLAGLGIALAALGLAWGPGFLIAAAPLLLLAALSWYRVATDEYPSEGPGRSGSLGDAGPPVDGDGEASMASGRPAPMPAPGAEPPPIAREERQTGLRTFRATLGHALLLLALRSIWVMRGLLVRAVVDAAAALALIAAVQVVARKLR